MSYTRGGKEGPPTQPTNGGARFRKGERRIGVKEDLLKGWRRGGGRGGSTSRRLKNPVRIQEGRRVSACTQTGLGDGGVCVCA